MPLWYMWSFLLLQKLSGLYTKTKAFQIFLSSFIRMWVSNNNTFTWYYVRMFGFYKDFLSTWPEFHCKKWDEFWLGVKKTLPVFEMAVNVLVYMCYFVIHICHNIFYVKWYSQHCQPQNQYTETETTPCRKLFPCKYEDQNSDPRMQVNIW